MEKYIKPSLEVIRFEAEDILTESVGVNADFAINGTIDVEPQSVEWNNKDWELSSSYTN